MTTGAPIYLVSACSSGEEFVAAFRRYADRNGLFVPIADPIAAGRRGWFAVALNGGGVMIEGEAEVVSSARTPSVLHGRVGMTLRFVNPDERSKIVLAELEKARLSMKPPPPPSVPPRPAELPPSPRPVPPAPGGRIDAMNALAECVAIGDLDALGGADRSAAPPKAGPKFVVPTVPPAAAPGSAAFSDETVEPTEAWDLSEPMGRPTERAVATPLDEAQALRTEPTSSVPAGSLPAGPQSEPTIVAQPGPQSEPTIPAQVGPWTEPTIPAQAGPRSSPAIPVPPAPVQTASTPATPAPRPPASTPPPISIPRTLTPLPGMPPLARPPGTGRSTASPPPPAAPPPAAPLAPLPPAKAAPPALDDELSDVEIDEPTDLTMVPIEAVEPAPRAEPATPPAAPPATAAPPVATPRSPIVGVPPQARVRPPNVEEPTPIGDWTMIPGADGPTIQPRTPPPSPRLESNPGDWSISLDPKSTDGWSEPPKLEQRAAAAAAAAAAPPPAAPPATAAPPAALPATAAPPAAAPSPGTAAAAAAAAQHRRRSDPMLVVTSTHPLESEPQRPVTDRVALPEPKVQVDPSLIEPLVAPPPPVEPAPPSVRSSGSQPTMEAPMAASSSTGMRLQHLLTPVPGFMPPYSAPPVDPGQASVPFAPGARSADATVRVRIPLSAALPVNAARRKRMIVIAVSAALVIALVAVSMVVAGSGEARSEATPQPGAMTPPGDAARARPIAAAQVDAAAAPAPPENGSAAPAAPSECTFDVTSIPAGAEVLLDKGVVATTPAKLTHPCDVELKLTFRKARFLLAERKYTPTATGKPLKVALAKPTFSVKVSSMPSGATVTVGGRAQGVTPTTIRLTANEASTLTFSKEGFTTGTLQVTPKGNNLSVTATLKRAPRKVPR